MYFDQQTHACACICMVKNDKKHLKIMKKVPFSSCAWEAHKRLTTTCMGAQSAASFFCPSVCWVFQTLCPLLCIWHGDSCLPTRSWHKGTLHLLPTLQNNEPVPQVMKQVVNLSYFVQFFPACFGYLCLSLSLFERVNVYNLTSFTFPLFPTILFWHSLFFVLFLFSSSSSFLS